MSLHLITLLGTLEGWLGGIAAHLIALVLAPVLVGRCAFASLPSRSPRSSGHRNSQSINGDRNAGETD